MRFTFARHLVEGIADRTSEAQKSRGVFGNFMACADYVGKPVSVQNNDVIDGDYVRTPAKTAVEAHVAGGRTAICSAAVPVIGMDSLRRRPVANETSSRAPRGPLLPIAAAGVVFLSFWVSGGHVLLAHAFDGVADTPDSTLRISTVASRIDSSGIRPLLFVDGEAANFGAKPESLPALEITITGHDGLLTRYRLGTADRLLSPGETFAFSSRLVAPKNGVRIVAVTLKE